jgi:hypothetical protein
MDLVWRNKSLQSLKATCNDLIQCAAHHDGADTHNLLVNKHLGAWTNCCLYDGHNRKPTRSPEPTMRARTFAPLAAVLATLLVVSACAETDSISAPRPVNQPSALLGDLLDGTVSTLGNVLVAPVQRKVPLAEPVSWSFSVGSGGATSSNSASGLTIAVPAGAVSQPVTITVTALAGSAVAYRFEPHGLQFARNVRLTQKTSHINFGLLNSLLMQGAHFPGDEPVYTNGLVAVTETVSASLNLLLGNVSFPIRHFSGWIIASGRSDRDSSDE